MATKLARRAKSLLKPTTEVRRVTFAERLANPTRFSLGGEYYIAKSIKKVTSRTAFVTATRRKDAIAGVSHGKAAAERQAGARSYKTAASERQAKAQIKTRVSIKERLALDQYIREPTHPITYLNTDGVIAHDYFTGTHLVTMHNYRDAFDRAIAIGDESGLRKFKTKVIITYDGPGLRNYDNKNAVVFPESNLKKIQAVLAKMTPRERARFDADRNYRHAEKVA